MCSTNRANEGVLVPSDANDNLYYHNHRMAFPLLRMCILNPSSILAPPEHPTVRRKAARNHAMKNNRPCSRGGRSTPHTRTAKVWSVTVRSCQERMVIPITSGLHAIASRGILRFREQPRLNATAPPNITPSSIKQLVAWVGSRVSTTTHNACVREEGKVVGRLRRASADRATDCPDDTY